MITRPRRWLAALLGAGLLLVAHPAFAALSTGTFTVGAPAWSSPKLTGSISYKSSSTSTAYSIYVYAYLFRTASSGSSPCNTSSSSLTSSGCGDVRINYSGSTNVFYCTFSSSQGWSCTVAPWEQCSTYTSGYWNYYWRAYYTNLSSNSAYVNGAVKSFYKACAS